MGLYSLVKKEALDLLFPHSCVGCGTLGMIFCASCRLKIKMIPPQCFSCGKLVPGSARVIAGRTCRACRKNSRVYAYLSPLSYSDRAVKELVHYLKYRRVKEAAGTLSDMLEEYIRIFRIRLPQKYIVVPIPLHKSRERTRGFNQAELIARGVGSFGPAMAFSAGVLSRNKNTRSQVDLAREERNENVKDAFVVSNPEFLRGKTAILVDDVKTTGATIEEAARTLKNAGVKRVWAITAAH